MPLENHTLPFRHSLIRYTRWGNGAEWLFCFHGYGEESDSFAFLEKDLGNRFTVIAIDFPFHGQTQWEEGLLFEPADLITIINQIKPATVRMHLLGYSMGGRVALQLLQLIPEQICKLVLVAPDGLHKNKWQWLATRTSLGKTVFAEVMKNPGCLLWLMDLAGKAGLYNKRLLKFVHYYLDDAEQRTILYRRWTTMRKFKPETSVLIQTIEKNKVPVSLLFGKYDSVILTKHGLRFREQAKKYITVTEIEAGHQLLREKYLSELLPLLVE